MESLRGDVWPIYNAGCCDLCGRLRAIEPPSYGGLQGFLFWHDKEVERAATLGVLTVTYGTYSGQAWAEITQRVSDAFEEHGMWTSYRLGDRFDVWLHTEDRRWFEDRMYEMSEERYWDFFLRGRSPEEFRLRSVFGAFRSGLRELEAERGRAARLIGDAVMDWAFRPGGACAKMAERSFQEISA